MQRIRVRSLSVITATVLASAVGVMAGNPAPTLTPIPTGPGEIYVQNPADWTQSSLLVDLDVELINSIVSPNGSIVTGSYVYNGVYDDFGELTPYIAYHGFFWSQATGFIDIPNPVERGNCQIRSSSADGQIAFGEFASTYPTANSKAARWTAASGWTELTGPFPATVPGGEPGSLDSARHGFACSADGSVVAARWTDRAPHPLDPESLVRRNLAAVWTAADGVRLLDSPPNVGFQGQSLVYAMSPNGQTLVGSAADFGQSNDETAVRWGLNGGAEWLGRLAINRYSRAQGVSADGSIVVGVCWNSGSPANTNARPFIWDATNGMRDVRLILENAGVTWTPLVDLNINKVSNDGRYIIGIGYLLPNYAPRSFVIDLGVGIIVEPVCPADFNGDDVRDVADLFAYINAWLAKTANADFNDDTTVDVADLFAYINAWLAGC